MRAEVIEGAVWETICGLIKNPELLIKELHKRNTGQSQTREMLERELQMNQVRLKAIPVEQKRLVEGYRKGLYPDQMMQDDMEAIQKEQGTLEKRKSELEGQLAYRELTQNQEVQIKGFFEQVNSGIEHLDFNGRRQLLRLLVEKVCYNGEDAQIQTVIPLNDQLHPIYQKDSKG